MKLIGIVCDGSKFIHDALIDFSRDGSKISIFLCLSKVMDGMYNIVNDSEIFILETT